MNLKVINCPDKNFKPYIEKAALFYAKELITNTRIRNNCFTTIRFDGNLEEYGYASVEDYNSKKEPREFLIEIHPGIVIFNGCITIFFQITVKTYECKTIIAYSGVWYKFFGVKESRLLYKRFEVFIWTIDYF